MKQLTVIAVILVFLLTSVSTSFSNPWGIGMKIVGELHGLYKLLSPGNQNSAENKNQNILDWAKNETVQKRAKKGQQLEFAEIIDRTIVNETAFVIVYTALLNSKQTIVAIVFKSSPEQPDYIQYLSIIFDDLDQYKAAYAKYNESNKYMVHGILLNKFGIDLGPIKPEAEFQTVQVQPNPQPAPEPSAATAQPVSLPTSTSSEQSINTN